MSYTLVKWLREPKWDFHLLHNLADVELGIRLNDDPAVLDAMSGNVFKVQWAEDETLDNAFVIAVVTCTSLLFGEGQFPRSGERNIPKSTLEVHEDRTPYSEVIHVCAHIPRVEETHVASHELARTKVCATHIRGRPHMKLSSSRARMAAGPRESRGASTAYTTACEAQEHICPT